VWWRSGLLTVDTGIIGLQFAGYLLEAGVVVFVLLRRPLRRLVAISVYLTLLLAVDGVSRPYVLYRYGLSSREYAYFFWLTDVLLALAAFLVLCAFFRRACLRHPQIWQLLRLVLSFVLVLVLCISILSLSRNYTNLFGRFIVEFQQNLYFTCLVLTTLLFILIQRLQTADEQLTSLVIGMGIQFSGPAANFALITLTPGQQFAGVILAYLGPLCTLGMLLMWLHAVARVPAALGVPAQTREEMELAAVASKKI